VLFINKILDIHKFELKKYVEELVDIDESDATSVDEDTDDEESEEEYESHHIILMLKKMMKKLLLMKY
jgi:hypothetical protein